MAESSNKDVFRRIYLTNAWRSVNTRSGPGSEGEKADQKIEIVKRVIRDHNVKSILDIGCGDFYWMKNVFDQHTVYLGLDIVPEIIEGNRDHYSSTNIGFSEIDLTAESEQNTMLDGRQWDLTICIDILGHLSNQEVSRLIRFLAKTANINYLLTTNRRDSTSECYLIREKSRQEGIDIEVHPDFVGRFEKLWHQKALFQNDWFDLYRKKQVLTVDVT